MLKSDAGRTNCIGELKSGHNISVYPIKPFPHTTNMQQTTLKSQLKNMENLSLVVGIITELIYDPSWSSFELV